MERTTTASDAAPWDAQAKACEKNGENVRWCALACMRIRNARMFLFWFWKYTQTHADSYKMRGTKGHCAGNGCHGLDFHAPKNADALPNQNNVHNINKLGWRRGSNTTEDATHRNSARARHQHTNIGAQCTNTLTYTVTHSRESAFAPKDTVFLFGTVILFTYAFALGQQNIRKSSFRDSRLHNKSDNLKSRQWQQTTNRSETATLALRNHFAYFRLINCGWQGWLVCAPPFYFIRNLLLFEK